jgi:preprotein translocase subunit SecD
MDLRYLMSPSRLVELDSNMGARFSELALVSLLVLLCVSCQRNTSQPLTKSAMVGVYQVSKASTSNSQAAIDPQNGAPIYIILPPIIASTDVVSVKRSEEESLTFELTPQGAQKLSAATTPTSGQELAIAVNGKLISVARPLAPLSSGFTVSGGLMQKHSDEIFATLTQP